MGGFIELVSISFLRTPQTTMSGTRTKQFERTRPCTQRTCHHPPWNKRKILKSFSRTQSLSKKKARIDSEALEKRRPTKEEERLWIEQQIVAAYEQWEKVLHDESDDEDGMLQIDDDEQGVKKEPVVKEEPDEE